MKLKFVFLYLLSAIYSVAAVNSVYLQLEGSTPSKRTTINRLLTEGTSLVGDSSNIPQVVDIATQAELNALSATYQGLDSDLTSIAALATTSFGRGLLTESSASTMRSTLGLVIGTNVQAYNANTSVLGSTIGLSEMDNLAQGTVIGRYSTGSGVPEALTWGGQFTITGGTISLTDTYQEANAALDELVAGTLTFPLTLSAGYTITGPVIGPYQSISGTSMDLTRAAETYLATSDATLSFSGTPATGQAYRLAIKTDSSPRTTTIPSSYNPETETNVTTITTNANSSTYLVFLKESDRWVVSGVPVPTSGSGSFLLQDTPTINAPTFTGSPSFSSGVKWTFDPSNTTAGFNPGSNATDPTSPANGDMYYQPGVGMRLRSEGAWLTVGSGGGGGSLASTDIDTSAEIDAIVSDNTGSGALVFAGSPTFTGTVTFDNLSATTLQASSLQFEGATADAFETIITVVDPTADNTWTLPNVSDTFVGLAATQTLTNKTINLTNNTFTATSAQMRTALSDETGTGAAVFADGNIGAATATTPAENDNDTSVATTAFVQTEIAGLGGGTDSTIDAYRQNVFLWEDFIQASTINKVYNGVGMLQLKADYNGTGATNISTSASDQSGAFGILQLGTGATTSNNSSLYTYTAGMFVNATQAAAYTYETRVKTGSSIAAMTLRIGFLDAQITDGQDGVFFKYDPASDASWTCIASVGGTQTTVDSGVDLATSTWYRLRVVINATGTQANFYINGTEVTGSPITSGNIPNASNELFGTNISIVTNEAVDKTLNVDYIGLQAAFSSAR